MPIVALFYNENGLSELDIFLLQAIYSVSVAVLEIPSGYMADRIGRRITILLGAILGCLGYGIYSISSDFSGFLVAEIILGLGGSFISGADSAMLYESLCAIRMRHRYLQFEGRITALGNYAETLAAICGGLIAVAIGYRFVYAAQTLIAFMAIPAALFLLEPPRSLSSRRGGLKEIILILSDTLLQKRRLAAAILLSSITGVATLTMAWIAQIYFVEKGFTEVLITPLWVLLNLVVALSSSFADKTSRLVEEKTLLAGFPLLFLIYILLGFVPVMAGIALLLLFYAIRGVATPYLKSLINEGCNSETRATVLSIRNLFIRFGFAVLGPTIGMIATDGSLAKALTIAGFFLFIFYFGALILYRR